jgi:hypothetical protein
LNLINQIGYRQKRELINLSGTRAKHGIQSAPRCRASISAFIASVATITLSIFATPVVAMADDHVAIFAGGQLDFANYVYGGVTVALPPSTIGNGFALRALIDSGGYDYVSGSLGTIKANFFGTEVDAMYQITTKHFWSDVALGANNTYTSLSPFDSNNPLRGRQYELRTSLDGGATAGPWRADWLGYYGTRLQDYAALLGVTHALSPEWRLGAEVYGEGNPTYNLRQVGPYAAVGLGQRSELQFSAGQAWESGFTPRVYVRALIYHQF